jgi:hypothetical protein
MYINIYIYIYMYIYLCFKRILDIDTVYIYICLYMHKHIYIYIHTHTHTLNFEDFFWPGKKTEQTEGGMIVLTVKNVLGTDFFFEKKMKKNCF